MRCPLPEMDVWYFAYGSNLLRSQMEARTGPIRIEEASPRVARLPGYRLSFNMNGGDGQVYANIVQPGAGVIGVIYRCGPEALEKLDHYELGYVRQQAVVIDTAGQELGAILYVAKPESRCTEGQPSAAYLEKIVTGAREQGLDEGYIRGIEALAGK